MSKTLVRCNLCLFSVFWTITSKDSFRNFLTRGTWSNMSVITLAKSYRQFRNIWKQIYQILDNFLKVFRFRTLVECYFKAGHVTETCNSYFPKNYQRLEVYLLLLTSLLDLSSIVNVVFIYVTFRLNLKIPESQMTLNSRESSCCG